MIIAVLKYCIGYIFKTGEIKAIFFRQTWIVRRPTKTPAVTYHGVTTKRLGTAVLVIKKALFHDPLRGAIHIEQCEMYQNNLCLRSSRRTEPFSLNISRATELYTIPKKNILK